MSGVQEQEQVFVAMKFTVPVVLFVELKLLWNRWVGNKIEPVTSDMMAIIVLVLGLRPRTISHNILDPGNNYYLKSKLLGLY